MQSRIITFIIIATIALIILPRSLQPLFTEPPYNPKKISQKDNHTSQLQIKWSAWAPRLLPSSATPPKVVDPFGKPQPSANTAPTTSTPRVSPLDGYRLQGTIAGKVATLQAPDGKRIMLQIGGTVGDAVLEVISSQSVQFRWQRNLLTLSRTR